MRKRKRIIESEPVKRRKKRRRPVQPQINIGKLIYKYLVHSYLYYEKNESVISDNEYDNIVRLLSENYELVEKSNHIHKHLIDKNALESFTGFGLIGRFPNIIKVLGEELLHPEMEIRELIGEI